MTALNSINIIKEAQAGNREALEKTVSDNIALVRSIARRFCGRGCDFEDLFQIGCIGLVKAVKRFDEAYNVKFSTYAVSLIMGEIKRFLRDDGMVKVSRKYKEIFAHAMAAKAKLSATLKREPKISEIAEETGVSPDELACAFSACMPCDSIYKTINDGENKESYLLDMLSDNSNESMFERVSLRCAVENLTEREKLVVQMRFFMDQTQSRVAKRLGVSQVQVSRIEKKLLSRLKEQLS